MRSALLRLSVLVTDFGMDAVAATLRQRNFISGLAVALVITLLLPLPRVPVQGKLHPLSLLRLLAQIAYWLVGSSIQIAWLAVKPGPPPLSAVLRAHFDNPIWVLTMAANIINLTPATIALEIDQARRIVYVHVINVGSDRTLKHFHTQMATLERLLVAALEREEDWRPATDKGGRVTYLWVIAAVLISTAAVITMYRTAGRPEHSRPSGGAGTP